MPFKIVIVHLYFSWIGRMQYFYLKGYWHEVLLQSKDEPIWCVKLCSPMLNYIKTKNYNKMHYENLTASLWSMYVTHLDLQNSRAEYPKVVHLPDSRRSSKKGLGFHDSLDPLLSWSGSLLGTKHIMVEVSVENIFFWIAFWISKFCRDKEKSWILNY